MKRREAVPTTGTQSKRVPIEKDRDADSRCPRTILVTLFDKVHLTAGGNAIGPNGGLDLTGCTDQRLVLRLDGAAGSPFSINEPFGPAGAVQQLDADIAAGSIDSLGSLNFRARFSVFGPRSFFIRVFERRNAVLQLSGSLCAVVG